MRSSALAAAAAVTLAALPAQAETALDRALAEGGRILAAQEIADLIVGRIVTARAGDRTFRFHYGPENALSGEMVGGAWSDVGYYGITDGDQVCLSMTSDEGRLRCLTLVEGPEGVAKYDQAGTRTFELLEFQAASGL
jgi:hypothetical protein